MSLQRTLKRRLRSLTRPLTSLWHVMTTNSSKTDEVMWELQVKTCSWNTISRASSVPSSDGSFQVRPKEAHWQLEIITERKKISLHLASVYSVMFTRAKVNSDRTWISACGNCEWEYPFHLETCRISQPGASGPSLSGWAHLEWHPSMQTPEQQCHSVVECLPSTSEALIYLPNVKGKEHTPGLYMRAPFLVSESRGLWWNTPFSRSLELTLRIFRKY